VYVKISSYYVCIHFSVYFISFLYLNIKAKEKVDYKHQICAATVAVPAVVVHYDALFLSSFFNSVQHVPSFKIFLFYLIRVYEKKVSLSSVGKKYRKSVSVLHRSCKYSRRRSNPSES
jgi:uncharacterized membrane protein YbhN (UPF0104 family)